MVRAVASFIGCLAASPSRTCSVLAAPCDQRKSITTCSSSLSGFFFSLRIVTLQTVTLQTVTLLPARVKGVVLIGAAASSSLHWSWVQLSDFDYTLPPELIAQEPLADRAASRMLVL